MCLSVGVRVLAVAWLCFVCLLVCVLCLCVSCGRLFVCLFVGVCLRARVCRCFSGYVGWFVVVCCLCVS